MFKDRRSEHFEKDTNKLIEENITFKNIIENLRKEKEKLKKENDWLKKENDRLKREKENLQYENLRLNKEILSLKLQECFNRILSSFNLKINLPEVTTQKDFIQKSTFSEIQLKWLEILKPPFRCLIIGKAGSGKTALAHFLLETFHLQKKIYIFGFPHEKIKFLPSYVNVVNSFEKILPDSVCLIDEAYLKFGARESMLQKNFDLREILGLFRHRNISLIFITQNTSLIDKTVLCNVDFLIFKEINMFNIKFERKELKKLAESVIKKFEEIKGDKKRWNYVFSASGDKEIFIENELPAYWNEELSQVYQSSFYSYERTGKTISNEEKRNIARQLKMQGCSYRQIAKIFGVSKSTIINWVKHQK
jgi:energy-coupling factor transporter ATP-binding protein EcfA2